LGKNGSPTCGLPFSVNEGARHRGAVATDFLEVCCNVSGHSFDAPQARLAANYARVLTLKMYNARFE
jgi:hypothetical protein